MTRLCTLHDFKIFIDGAEDKPEIERLVNSWQLALYLVYTMTMMIAMMMIMTTMMMMMTMMTMTKMFLLITFYGIAGRRCRCCTSIESPRIAFQLIIIFQHHHDDFVV